MSLFNWFSGKPAAVSGKAKPESSGLAGGGDHRPAAAPLKTAAVSSVRASSAHKSHRHARRELLYTAVREAMIRAGVLSASYKFKVLSLDPRGEQFMVMIDLSQEFGGQPERLAEIEVMIAQSAKSRYNIRVTAVYWRLNELVSVARPAGAPQAGHRPTAPRLAEAALAAAALPAPAMAALKPSPVVHRYEPIQADEVAAFKQALAAASAQGVPAVEGGAPSRSRLRSYTLLTGFEDTEMPDSPALVPALSATQYGDLN
ncbi:MAG: hypothetical protein Q8O29_03955 [Polaromonas sp.]|uniref:hypothetical protein n=1 Tax=Polaromonas sp. TaxID=1869339 RepID=UPI00273633E0|nr:hypothetical protein [Polaromonas sp.]MDP2817431.1 hypothetical protein [Polaromonas sp.]